MKPVAPALNNLLYIVYSKFSFFFILIVFKIITCAATSRKNSIPFSKSGNTMEPNFLTAGAGKTLIVASVIMPLK